MRPERLPVAVSDPELHAIETVESFETPGTFVVAIENHGRDAHVHLKLDDDLASVATLSESNVYVERDATREVEVVVDGDATARGRLRIETGYGSESTDVTVVVGTEQPDPVAVDDRLGQPTERSREEGDDEEMAVPTGWVPVTGLAVAALALAGATVAFVEDPVVIGGVLVVLFGVVAAGAMLLWR